jgi:poly-gamma-glutamate capsule biosynthesis protein CapA/YwtB (metallophosphatase superfamily)
MRISRTPRRIRGLGIAALLVAALGLGSLAASSAPTRSTLADGATTGPSAAASASPAPSIRATPASPAPVVYPSSSPTTAPVEAIVPIVSFWSTQRDIRRADVARLWRGLPDTDAALDTIAVATDQADALTRVLGARAGNVHLLAPADVIAAVRATPGTLGLVPAEDVVPQIRALAVDGTALFGSSRIKILGQWPLLVPAATAGSFSTRTEWTLAAGGDVNLDRAVYVKAVKSGYGPDFPWSAGYATIDGPDCCAFDGTALVLARDQGPAGALSRKLAAADLALVNLEGSAPDDFTYRFESLVFTFDPALLIGLKNAGIDAVSLANNHIRNGGDQGVLDTCTNLDAIGLAHTGAGADATAARKPAWLRAGGLRVAVLGYSAVGLDNWASDDHPGAAALDIDAATADIKAARAAGADIVIVMPHWGQEYSYSLSGQQEDEAAAFVAAGADLVLASHSHWVGAIQSIDRPQGPAFIDYSLGDFLFDLNHDIEAQEGVIATLTFSGKRLVQVELDPTVMIDGAQVGLMDPAGDGRGVLDAIRAASGRVGDW